MFPTLIQPEKLLQRTFSFLATREASDMQLWKKSVDWAMR